jgi:imidazoleglycerol-phosphate dehydratase
MKKRKAKVMRKTKETNITADLVIDGKGLSKIDTGIPFLDHMLTLFSKHGFFDLKIKAKGDIDVDIHHTNEDVGIVLGEAFKKALSDKKGIQRFGSGESFVPMDGSLARVALDISNRPSLHIHNKIKKGMMSKLFEMSVKDNMGNGYSFVAAEHFLRAFVMNSGINMHVEILSFDRDFHHLIEAVFKALGRGLDQAARLDPRSKSVPSTKGKL